MQILWLVGITVPEVFMMAKITCNGPNKNTLFNILPNKTKTHSLIYFQKKQKSEESKQGEQSKWLLLKITNK